MTKTVLLYGDSILWGVDGKSGGRHPREARLDTIVQRALGEDVDVIGEGHRGRTMFGENGAFPKRNGLEQFGPIFASHLPIDVLVIMLGTNDVNAETRHSSAGIAAAIDDYMAEAKEWCDFMGYSVPKLLIVSPPDIDDTSLVRFAELFAGSSELIGPVVDDLSAYASAHGHTFIDSRTVAKSISTDGIHLDAPETKKLADAIAARLADLLA